MHSQLFSNKTRGFYPVKSLRYFKSVGTLPDDLVRIPDSEHGNYYGEAPANCVPHYNAQTRQMEWLAVKPQVKTKQEIIDINLLEQKARLQEAALIAFPLQAAVDVGEATEVQTDALAQIKRYTVDVLKTKLTVTLPAWPEKPTIML